MKQLKKIMVALIAVLGINVSLAAETAADTCAHTYSGPFYAQICTKCSYPFDGLTKCNHANDIKAGITVTPVGTAPAGWDLWDPDNYASNPDALAYFGERDGRNVYIVYKFTSAKASYITKQVNITHNGETKCYDVIIDASVLPAGAQSFISTPKALKFENGIEIVTMADKLLTSSGSGRLLYEVATEDVAKLPITTGNSIDWFYIDADCSAKTYTDRLTPPTTYQDGTVMVINRNTDKTHTLYYSDAAGTKVTKSVLPFANVYIDPNGGEFKGSTEPYNAGKMSSTGLSVAGVPTKDGVVFDGWKFSFAYDLSTSGNSLVCNLTLTAQWKEAPTYIVGDTTFNSVEDAVAAAKNNNSAVELPKSESSSSTIPEAVKDVAVKVEVAAGAVEFDKNASAAAAGATLNIVESDEKVEGAAIVYEITLVKGSSNVSELSGSAVVTIPLPTALEGKKVAVFFVAEDGTKTAMENVTVADGRVSFTTTHFSTYSIEEALNWTGAGTEANPYVIGNVDGLVELANRVNAGETFAGQYFKLGADIDLSGAEWPGIGVHSKDRGQGVAFKGVFNGNDKTISGLMFENKSYNGFFNQIDGATVKNLTIQSDITLTGGGGAFFVGSAHGSTIENCVAKGSFVATHNVAGIVTYLASDSIIRNCRNLANLSNSDDKIGGIACVVEKNSPSVGATIEGCVNEGTLTVRVVGGGSMGVGGMIGYQAYDNEHGGYVTLKNCENKGTIVDAQDNTSAKIAQMIGYSGCTSTLSGNKGLDDTLAIGHTGSETTTGPNGIDGLNYATVENGVATYLKNSEVVAGGTYLVTAQRLTPSIALKGGESITFDQTLATIDAIGITPVSADGAILEPKTEGAKVTYTAAIAKVGEAAYGDFNTALEAAKDAEDKTVTVLGDVNWGDGFTVPEGVIIKTGADVTVKAPTSYVWENMSLVKVTNWLQIADATWYNDSGTEFTISTAQELAGLITLVNGGDTLKDKTITLAADIDLSGATLGTTGVLWDGIGVFQKFTADGKKPFEGTFNGNNKTISNMTFSNGKYRGLFNLIMNGAVVKDLTVTGNGFGNSEVPATGEFGGAMIAGGSYGATIQNCVAEGTFITTHNTAGIAVTVQDTTIDGCTSRVNITCTADKFGGIVCLSENNSNETSTQIKNSVNDGSLHVAHVGAADDNDHGGIHGVGGIVGYLNHGASKGWIVIENCTNKGAITKIAENEVARIGQIAGYPNAEISPTGNKGLTTTLAAGANAWNGLAYATVAEENGINVATYVKSGDLKAGNTYLVTAPSVKPVIALKGGESITFDASLITYDASGITAASVLMDPKTDGNKTTYTAALVTVGSTGYTSLDTALAALETATDKTVTIYGAVTFPADFTLTENVAIKLADGVTDVKAPIGYEWSGEYEMVKFNPSGSIGSSAAKAFIVRNHDDPGLPEWVTLYTDVSFKGQKSLELKLYSGDKLLGISALKDDRHELLTGKNSGCTAHFFLNGSDPEWWTTTLAVKHLLANEVPDKMELWIDDVKVDEGSVYLSNSNDNMGASTIHYNWGDLDNVMVAKIDVAGENGETEPKYYDTLQEAIDAAAAGETVTLIGDTRVLGAEVEANSGEFFVQVLGKNLTLDLNGKTVNGSFYLNSGSTVKFQNGTILNLAGNASSGIESVGGNIELTNMTISNTVRHAIRVKGGTAVINGGNYAATGNGTFHVVNVSHASTVTINGGTFTGNKGNSSAGGNTVMIQDDASKVAINGGAFTNAAGVEGCICAAAGLVISGGTYDTWTYDNYLATDKKYLAIKNADDLYEVVEFTNWAQVANTSWYNAQEPQTAYTLSSAEQLAGLAKLVNAGTSFADATITLGADIDLSGASYGEGVSGIAWTPIGADGKPFSGVFDGAEKTISNLVITGYNSNVGLFGRTEAGEVKNFTLTNAQVSGRLNVGAVSGSPYTSKYTDITVNGLIQIQGMSYVGGAFGKNVYAAVTNVDVFGDEDSYVKADSVENGSAYRTYVGGLAGFTGENTGAKFRKIQGCDVQIDVTGSTSDVGGLVGIVHYGVMIIECSYKGTVTLQAADGARVGKFAGVAMNNATFNTAIVNSAFDGHVVKGETDVTDTTKNYGGYYYADGVKDSLIIGTDVAFDANEGITAGLFGLQPPSNALAEGAVAVENGNGTWTVYMPVAKIGDTPYATIQAAIDAATETANTIVVVGDVTESGITVATDDKVVIDLNDNTVYGYFMVYGDATIKNGTIDSRAFSTVSAIETNNEADRTLNPKLVTENLTILSGRHALRVDGGTVNIKSGSYTAADAASIHAVNISSGGKVTIDGGMFVGNSQSGTGAVAMRDDASELTINDGTFTGGLTGSLTVWSGTTTVNGGTFETVYADQPVTIVGGVFDAVNKLPAGSNITGGTFKTDPSQYLSEGYVGVKQDDGTYKVEKVTNWIQIADTTWFTDDKDTYTLTMAQELAGLAKLVNEGNTFAGKTVYLGENIDLGAYAWTPIALGSSRFCGVFDGAQKTIANLKCEYTDSTQGIGLFGNVGDNSTVVAGAVKNIKVFNAMVTGGSYSVAVVCARLRYGTIENCDVSGNVSVNGGAGTGVIVGLSTVPSEKTNAITDCDVSGKVTLHSVQGWAGGIVGQATRTVIDGCTVIGTATTPVTMTIGENYGSIGGIMGNDAEGVTIQNCSVNYVKLTGERVGGISGLSNALTVLRCSARNLDLTGVGNLNLVGSIAGANNSASGGVSKLYNNTTDSDIAQLALYTTDGSANNSAFIGKSVALDEKGKVTKGVFTVFDETKASTVLAPRAYWTKNDDATYTVRMAVAEMDGAKYSSLQSAIDAAVDANGGTVKLLADTDEAVEVANELTLDLNGRTVAQVTVPAGASLKIDDSVAAQTPGKIERLVLEPGAYVEKTDAVADANAQAPTGYTWSNNILTANKQTVTVTVSPVGSGEVTGIPTEDVKYGDKFTLKAIPATGYVFAGWTGDFTKLAAEIEVEVADNVKLTATFVPAALFTAMTNQVVTVYKDTNDLVSKTDIVNMSAQNPTIEVKDGMATVGIQLMDATTLNGEGGKPDWEVVPMKDIEAFLDGDTIKVKLPAEGSTRFFRFIPVNGLK